MESLRIPSRRSFKSHFTLQQLWILSNSCCCTHSSGFNPENCFFFLTLLVDPFLYEDKNLKMQSTNWVWLKSQGREKKMAILRLVFMAWAVFWFRCKISRIKKRMGKNRKTIAIKNILRNMSTVVSVRKRGRGSHSQCLLTYIFF